MSDEPVLSANTLVALVSAVLVLAISFGMPMTEEQRAAILGVVVIVAPIAAALWARSQVTPLADPRDIDGAELTRPDNTPALPAQGRMIQQARGEMQSDFFARGLYK